MQRPVQITYRDIAPTEALESQVREKAAKLEEFYPFITGCHVTLEVPHKHKHQGKHCAVRIDVRVPGGELVVNHDHHEDMYVALRDAFLAHDRNLLVNDVRQKLPKNYGGSGARAKFQKSYR